MDKINIAIDGPVGSGKGITAKRLAQKLGYKYLDTGAMYRALALFMTEKGVRKENFDVKYLEEININFDENNDVILNGRNVALDIRGPEISMLASDFSVIVEVRKFLTRQQQEIVKVKGYIAEGRDIGTVVIPGCEVKIYLDAKPEIRAQRRLKDYIDKGIKITEEEVLKQTFERDEQDMNKPVGALKKAEDAFLVDNSEMTIDEQVDKIYDIVMEKLK